MTKTQNMLEIPWKSVSRRVKIFERSYFSSLYNFDSLTNSTTALAGT
jgi:hypothetical protein